MKKNVLRIILLVCLFGVFYMIFQFSAQDGEESRGTSYQFISNTIDVFNKNIIGNEREALIENITVFVRKMAHFSIL